MRVQQLLYSAALATAIVGAVAPARADLVYLGETNLGAQGFGSASRLLTIQNTGTESGAIGVLNGAIVALTPGIANGSVFSGNGITNAGGNTVNPLTGDKFSIPTLGSLNWANASQVQIVFNAAEPGGGGSGLNITDLTLKFYNGNTVIAAIDGSQAFASTVPGVGNSGYLFGVDAAQQTFLNSTVFNQVGASGFRIALESTITGAGGGPESFSAVLGPPPEVVTAVPEISTWLMMMIGFAAVGFAAYRRTTKKISAIA